MKLPLLVLTLALLYPLTATETLGSGFENDIQVIVDTEFTPQGALLPTPSPEKPIYYISVSSGLKNLGASKAGEMPPEKKLMFEYIAKALAKQGYLPSNESHEASILLVFTWGSYYSIEMPDPRYPNAPAIQVNRKQKLRFLGGEKMGLVGANTTPSTMAPAPGLSYMNANAKDINEAASDDLYMSAVAAYDLNSVLQKDMKLLWISKISCPSRGLAMAETLPTMIDIATPHIGRETPAPVWIAATDKYKANVRIGDATVKGYEDPATTEKDGKKTRATK